MKEKINYGQILKQREFCKAIVASMISRFGDSIDAIAFSWLVYQITGSAAWAALIFSLNRLPSIFLQPLAGPMVERLRKKYVIIGTDFTRGIIVAALVLLYNNNLVTPYILVAFTLIISSVEAFEMPAATALLPQILEEKYFEHGVSFRAILCTVTELIGTGIAGVIIGFWGIQTAIMMDAITFFAAAFVKAFIHVKEDKSSKGDCNPVKRYLKDLKEGFLYLKSKKTVINFVVLAVLVNAVFTPLNSFQAPLVSDVLNQGSELLSAMGVACVIGSGLGSLLYPMIAKRCKVRSYVCLTGLVAACSPIICVLGHYCQENVVLVYAFSCVGFGLVGMAASILSSTVSVLFMKNVEQEYMAREASILNAASTAAMPVTGFAMSALGAAVPILEILVACGVICGIIFIGFWAFRIQLEDETCEG